MRVSQKITPCFGSTRRGGAVNHHISILENSAIINVVRFGKATGSKGHSTITFQLHGSQEFIALNGGPQFKFTGTLTFRQLRPLLKSTRCGTNFRRRCEQPCGWLKDN
jgi:predicted 3-demethylubiquinone-9 3-methyltransferase (glyoxalase superfamily)